MSDGVLVVLGFLFLTPIGWSVLAAFTLMWFLSRPS